MKTKTKSILVKALFAVLLAVLVFIEIARGLWSLDEEVYLLLSRLVGGVACLLFMLEFSFTGALSPVGNRKPLLWLLALPGFIIAINNFPFVSFFTGDCDIGASADSIFFYALICLATGFFEEMAFRGCAFMLLLKNRTQSKGRILFAIFVSSAVFGLIHLVNVFFGGSLGASLLQVGYSALIGALCSMVLLLTGNIWLCVALHAIYNFCGGLVDRFGVVGSVQWTRAEIIFTAIVSVIVAAYFVVIFVRMPNSLADALFGRKKEEELENNVNSSAE